MSRRQCTTFITSLVIAFASLAGFAAAQSKLIIGTAAELLHLDPRIATDVSSFERINVISEPLVVFDTSLSLTPRLATSWEFSDEGRTLTFELREGVKFHDGSDFTSADVKYTFDWVLNPDNAAQNRGLYMDIASIDTPDEYTVVMNLSNANSFLLNNIARMPLVPAGAGENENFTFNPVGTGPYRFESLQRDDRLVLHAFDDYWGGRGEIDVVEFHPIPEDGTRLLAFEAGEIHVTQSRPVPAELARLEADSRFVVERAPGTGYEYVGMNNRSAPLDNVLVRQAISHLVHREAIVERVLNGIGQPGVSMLSPELAWFNPDVPQYPYDPERAAELLAEAGLGEGVTLRLFTDEKPVNMQVAEIMQAEMAGIGIDLEITIEEWGAFLERIQTTDDYDLFVLSWHGQLDPDRAMQRQFSTDGSANFAYYSNDRVDALLAAGRLTPPDSPESLEIYREAQELVLADAPFAFINYTEEIALYHPWVEGWSVHTYGPNTFQNLHQVKLNR